MEPTHGGGGGGGGGPAPFLLKTYEMVDDSSTDDVVSWSEMGTSFVVWNPPEFAARLLPMYFKHNNFSSFIRQLNTYGFRKSDPERWEFANEHFINGQKQLLKSIHRRKPIHSHSQPSTAPQAFSDRAALEEEIDRLSRERTALQTELWRFKHQQSGAKVQMDDIERRIHDMEQRQVKMVAFLHKAMANPKFMDNLLKYANGLMGPSLVSLPDPSSLSPESTHLKKRRLPNTEMEYSPSPDLMENNSRNGCYDDHCSSNGGADFMDQSLCDKLKLELCPAMAAMSTQSSNRETDNLSPHVDSGTTSLCPLRTVLLDSDGVFPPHLDLTLASCTNMEIDRNDNIQDVNILSNENGNEIGNGNGENESRENEKIDKEENAGPPARINDVFWEQFLTDKTECNNEEASSSLRATPNPSPSPSPREGGKDMERLKL